jgi:protein-S-isoprenylcysteine O-methyltransferase Ste14
MIPETEPASPTEPPRAWHGPRGELLVALQFLLFIAFALMPAWGPWLPPPHWTLAPRVLLLGSCALASLTLGGLGALKIRRYLTPLPYPVDHNRLVTDGAYAVVRHPLYSSLLFLALGWTCWTLSLSHLALLALGFLFFDYKAGKEENWLAERHPEYADYKFRVKKLIPWLY